VAHGVRPVDGGLTIGTVFQGKYRVDSIIGHGGMGVVAECTHLALNERVAIKMLRQDVLLDQDAVQRFVREAQAAVKLKSEYVARVSDVGTFENGTPYMVMEFLEGHDLGELLKQRGVLPVPWASELMLQTCEALAEAHSLGIVHRDVKPTNLFVTWRPDGSALVKVLDFGISKSPMGTDMQLTQTQSLLGTPAYMSPEQMRSARLVDTRTDIWSLGTVFYEVVEGRRPFEAESFSEMCVKVAVDAPAPMVNAPLALQKVILRCLAKTPEQRYANMADLAHDLVPFVNDPHQATLLVERMNRMLRRSQHGWDGDSTSSTRTPRIDRQDLSGRVATPQPWNVGSEPFGAPVKTPRRDQSQPLVHQDPSEPFAAAPSTIMTAQPHRRRWPFILVGFALLIGAGIALGVVMSNPGDEAKAAATETTPPDKTPPDKVTPDKATPDKATPDEVPDKAADVTIPTPDKAAPDKAAPDKATPDKATPDKATADKATPDKAAPDKAAPAVGVAVTPDKAAGGHPIRHQNTSKNTPKTNSKDTVVKPDVSKPAVKDETPVVTPKPKCDPFNAMHGCAEAKPPAPAN
jgi:serine/threonine-protein kinase